MDNFWDELNPPQAEVVRHKDGPLLILAGAGSGKTRTITYRIAHLIESEGVSPHSILAITFTNKAAAEMKQRIEKLCGAAVERMWVKTFHSACVQILRRDIERLGYKSSFNIYDSSDQKTLVKDCLKALGLSDENFPVAQVISLISSAKDKLIEPSDFAGLFGNEYRMKIIEKIYELYQDKLKKNNAVDFDDLICLTVKLFRECPDVLEFYQNRFRYILVDEYQDTNNAQYMLISLLAAKYRNLCVVGDDDQSIYKFRGANIRNILDFEKDFKDAVVIRLEQNYRSTGNILESANNVIKHNLTRKGKKLWTASGEGDKVIVYCAPDEYGEADFIASEIRRSTYKLSDIAILYRTNNQSRVIEERLRYQGIPHRILSGLRFYDRKEIKDMIAYFRLVNNPDDDISLRRVINEPKRGIGKVTMDNIQVVADRQGVSLFRAVESFSDQLGKSADKLKDFTAMINRLRQETLPLTAMVAFIIEKSGYVDALMLSEDVEARTRVENIGELVSGARNFEETSEDPTFQNYLDSVSLISDVDNYDEDQDSVVLMTIHSAKGLEFPVVFICGVEDSLFPSERSKAEDGGIEEERRLCYVAITRARERLYMSYATERRVYGKTERHRISPFISELPKDKIDMQGMVKKAFEHKETKIIEFKGAFNKENIEKREFNFTVGERVSHKKFGEGTILVAQPVGNDVRLEVAFDSIGTKHLMAVYANLTKI